MKLTRPKERIDAKALIAWRIRGCVYLFFYVLTLIGFLLIRHFIMPTLPLLIFLVALATFLLLSLIQIIIIPAIRMVYWGYQINEHEIEIQHGIIVIKRTLIPMTRIQHVDTEHGPIMRLFSLATLNIATAGTSHKIPALKNSTASELRKQIAELAALSDDDV